MEIPSTSSGINVEEISPSRRQIYYKLRNIFPGVTPAYIKEIVINPNQFGVLDNGTILDLTTVLIEHLIVNGIDHMDLNSLGRLQSNWELEKASSYEMQANRLVEIFPDADPEFLSNFAKIHYKQTAKINSFIEENLIKKSYPTREEYVARKKLEESFRKYFTEFNATEFLAEIPNPIEYFESENRICSKDLEVMQLFVYRFTELGMATIDKIYRNSNFNPSLTAAKLEKFGEIMKEYTSEQMKNLTHMQEFSFICHRKLIVNKLKEEEDVSKLSKEKNELLRCETCFNDFISSKCSTCDNGHIFCNDCISSATEYRIADAIYTMKCFVNCDSYFSQKTLKKVLSSKVFNVLMKKQQETELAFANISNLENCPFCDFKCQVDEGNKIFSCLNEDCKKQSCRMCRKLNHLPVDCSDVLDTNKSRLYLEEKMTKALIRTCYNCGKGFVKEEGCNRMVCICKAVMCYLCDKPVSAVDYKHFNTQGSSNHHLCPLFSDDSRQEAEAVLEVALITKQEILKRDPNFNAEIVDQLLPKLPPKTAGPHDQISNANQLPERAIKITNAISS